MDAFMRHAGRGEGLACFIHDGGLVSSPDTEAEFPVDLLRRCEQWILEQTGWAVTLVEKKMVSAITLPAAKESADLDGYAAMKAEFEKHHFKCIANGMFYDTSFPDLIIRTERKMRECFCHLNYQVTVYNEGVPVQEDKEFLPKWLKDKNMRCHQFTDCYPPPVPVPANCYNLWRGFAIASHPATALVPAEADMYAHFMTYLRKLCNDDGVVFDYVLDWFACVFQKPGWKNSIALLFKSLPGLGKDLLAHLLIDMVGKEHCVFLETVENDIFGPFNHLLRSKILVFMNEFTGASGQKYDSRIKNLITCETDLINQKGIDSRAYRSYAHYVLFTNTECPVKIDLNERRFLAIANNSTPPGKAFFTPVFAMRSSPNVLRKFYDDLMARPIDGVDWRGSRPMTEFYRDMRVQSLAREMAFIADWVQECARRGREVVEVRASKLCGEFAMTLTGNYDTSPVKFGIKVKNFLIKGLECKQNRMGQKVYVLEPHVAIASLIEKKVIGEDWNLATL